MDAKKSKKNLSWWVSFMKMNRSQKSLNQSLFPLIKPSQSLSKKMVQKMVKRFQPTKCNSNRVEKMPDENNLALQRCNHTEVRLTSHFFR